MPAAITLGPRKCEDQDCENEFTPTRRSHRFCSHACNQRSVARRRPNLTPRKCEQCGDEFKPLNRHHRFCSATCSAVHGSGVPNRQNKTSAARRGPIACAWEPCGKTFQPTNGRAKYCSRLHRLRDWRAKSLKAGPAQPVTIFVEMEIGLDPDDLPEAFWLAARCPTCKAKVGDRCRYPDGRYAHHAGRVEAVRTAVAARIVTDVDMRAAAAATFKRVAFDLLASATSTTRTT
jgi:hypothetical protein